MEGASAAQAEKRLGQCQLQRKDEANVTEFSRLEDIDPDHYAAVLWIATREMPMSYKTKLAGRSVTYRPATDVKNQ